MMRWFKQHKALLILPAVVLVMAGLFAFAPEVLAQNQDFGIQDFEQETNLGNTDLRIVIARIVNVFLGILGIILVGLVLYGGFLWMTAAGNDEQVGRAKKLLGNAVIGLVIILSSFSITRFLLSRLEAAVNGDGQDIVQNDGNDPNNNCVGAACNPAGGGNDEDQCLAENALFVAKAITPNTSRANDGNTGHKDMVVRVIFSEPVNRNQNALGVVTLLDDVDNEIAIKEAVYIDGRRGVEVTFDQDGGVCQFGNEVSCLQEGKYQIVVNENVRSASGNKQLRVDTPCGEFPLRAGFANENDALDNQAPTIAAIAIDGKTKEQVGIDGITILRGEQYDIKTDVRDRQNGRGGIGYVKVELQNVRNQNDTIVYLDGPRTRTNSHGPYELDYNLQIGARTDVPTKYDVTITGYDMDGNSTIATSSFIVVGEDCQNGELDAGEIDIDVGGNCVGMGRCEANWQCASQRCVNNQCVASPIIEDVLPAWDGGAQNMITIVGKYFGQDDGDIIFDFVDNQGVERSVNLVPPQCDAVADTWTDNWIIAEVPVDAAVPRGTSSSIRVVRDVQLRPGEAPYEDSSTDNRGPKAGPHNGYFVKNDVVRPGLCSITDRQNNLLNGAAPSTAVIAHGRNLGQNQGELLFGRIPANVENWQNSRVFSAVPNMNAEDIFVSVRVGDNQSNGVPFTVQDVDADLSPEIAAINPQNPTPGSNITISGDKFGNGLGSIYLAPDQATAINCAQNPNNCILLDAQVCGDSWGRNQVIVGIPADIAIGEWNLMLRTQDGRQTDGSNVITVRAGAALPSICAVVPDRGPAPLTPGGDPLLLTGKNFSNNPSIYFWTLGSNADDLQTWLSSANQINGRAVLIDANDEEIETLLPEANVNGRLASMQTGPIVVQNDAGELSNPVRYTVSDCRVDIEDHERLHQADHPLIVEGYRCCIEGPDTGAWRQNGELCEGEERTSGYVWRFTTGLIPQIPDVIEQFQCVQNETPSPSPWARRNDGGDDGVCLNAMVNVRFTLNMDANTITDENVNIYTCGNNAAPDCGDYDNNVDNRFTNPLVRVNGFSVRHRANNQFEPDTWYRVVLSDDIAARHNTGARDINGQPIFSTATLRIHDDIRDLPDGAAYYFDFKTGSADGGVNGDGLCQIIGADIDPPRFTASYLGQLQDPRFVFDPFNLQAVLNPQYYYVLGRADQACILLDVDDENWQWGSSNQAIATAAKSVAPQHQNDRATVSALQDSQGDPVFITADADINGNDISGTSTLYVNLGDPQVVQAWPVPDCQFSCTNVSVGVRFNRPMMPETFKDGNNHRLRVRECVDADCDAFTNNVIRVIDSIADRYIYQVDFADPAQLATGTWYLADVPADILSIGRVAGNEVFAGDPLTPFQWKFRIKEDDPICRIARAEVYPDPFTAQILGQKTRYSVVPVSAPDQCSSFGQRLNAWGYGWRWASSEDPVASISNFESQAPVPNYCTASCVYAGSSIHRDAYAVGEEPSLCGNGIVESGEDCDIGIGGEIIGQSCTLDCVRPGSEAATCGDGEVQTLFGEECDPGGDKAEWEGCSEQCINTGSPLPVLCGDGDITNGEDCDGGVGCSATCLNQGSAIAQSWCDIDANRQQAGVACAFAQSVCGDGVLDKGEECEILGESIRVASADRRGVIDINVGVDDAARHCSPSCLLQDLCALDRVPSVDQGGIRCDSDDEGCRADCHILGGSVDYSVPSMCSDGVRGIGEYEGCRVPNNQNPIGQNPHQVATAIGQGDVNPATKSQETDISATAVRVREADGSFTNVNPPVSGIGDYALQCGYTERAIDAAAFGPNIIQDGDMEAGNTDVWELGEAPMLLKKNQDDPFDGIQRLSLTVDKNQGGDRAGQQDVPLEANTVYRLSFWYQIPRGEAIVAIGDGGNPDVQQQFLLQQNGPAWQAFEQDIRFADVADIDLQFIIDQNQAAFADGPISLLVDGVSLQAQIGGVLSTTENDCRDNADNSLGVGTNSCCAVRPAHNNSYPEDGSIGVCRNTLLEVAFQHETIIDDATIEENILLAEGFVDPNHNCVDQDVTDRVTAVLAAADDNVAVEQGFFSRMWTKVKGFFARLFGLDDVTAAALHDNIATWCTGRIAIDPSIRYEWAEENAHVTSTISLALGNVLDSETIYAVVLEGGVNGMKDARGVSIRGTRPDNNGRFADDGFISFRTSAEICRLRTVTIDPVQELFSVPLTTSSFTALPESTSGGQLIQAIPGVYDWDWRWVPDNHPIFAIPVPGASTSTRTTVIGARELEGELIASGQAAVTFDITEGQDNHTGRVFAGQTRLIADFCERPWPARDAFPYEDDRFNFSMSYCADAGLQGVTEDDLPYFILEDVINPEEIANAPGNVVEGTLQKLLFFNDQNEDVLGIQIFQNPGRLSARDWFNDVFGFGAENLQSLSLDGYDAITDGSNIYVNALNVAYNNNGTRNVYNNIYLISVNEGAQPQTREVLEQLLGTLRFNTNLSNIGFCLAAEVDANVAHEDRRIPRDTDPNIAAISPEGIQCNTDFDCRDIFGQPVDETNGICSNAKTKFITDWQRIAGIKASQDVIEQTKAETGSYPLFNAGTFIPKYTNSRWPSWGRLAGVFTDPVNQWGACGRCSEQNDAGQFVSCINDAGCPGEGNVCEIQDLQTCWDAQNAQYICPQYSQITEYYASSTEQYMLHSPLGYFNDSEAVVAEFVSTTHFTADPWCEPGDLHSPFAGQCGDGVVNLGEQCDPPGAAEQVQIIVDEDNEQLACAPGALATRVCSDSCTWNYGECRVVGECGNGILDGDEICDDGALNGRFGQCDAPEQRADDPNTAVNESLGCRSIGGAGQCRNGQLDFEDLNNNGDFDAGEPAFEFCDEVGGVCQFIVDDVVKIEPILYFLIDQSGSMNYIPGADINAQGNQDSRWDVILGGMPNVARAIEGKAKIGIAVFSGNKNPPVEILEVGFHSVEEVSNALAGAGNPGGNTPVRSAIESIREDNVFESEDPVDAARPKSLILLVDGDATRGEDPGQVISDLRVEDEIYTYVFGVGNSEDSFRDWAVAGGTDNFFRVDQPNEFRARIQNVTRCYEYSLRPGDSCSLDCQSYGDYCGDGVVQAIHGEQCDDGNFIDDDGCDAACRTGEAQVAEELVGRCGDGEVQTPNRDGIEEVCDTGDQNGIRCNPDYGENCSYCSQDCREVLSVDPIAYCGNGQIDYLDETRMLQLPNGNEVEIPVYEACDIIPGSETVITAPVQEAIDDPDGFGGLLEELLERIAVLLGRPETLEHEVRQCFDNPNPFYHKGNISCSDDCRILVDECVNCGIIPAPGAEPLMSLVNVLENPDVPGEFRGWDADLSYYFVRRTSNNWIQRLSAFGIGGHYRGPNPLLTESILNGRPEAENPIAQGPRRIEANPQCTDVYSVLFNAEEIANGVDNNANYSLNAGRYVGGELLDQLIDQNRIGLINYPVAGEAVSVNNTLFVSNPVPSTHMRVVVRWDADGRNNLTAFTGNVFSDKYEDEFITERGGRLSYMDVLANNRLCDSVELQDDIFFRDYWMPVGCDNFELGMTMSEVIEQNNQYVQATTINLRGLGNRPERPIAFFVGAVANDNNVSISAYERNNVRVEVYMHHPGQNNTHSLFGPDYVFTLNDADRSQNQAIARYWHPFNIIQEGEDVYRLYEPARINAAPIETTERNMATTHGSIETDFVDVLCNVPGQQCNRDR